MAPSLAALPAALLEVHDATLYGSKAVRLGEALRARLPVPRGVALPAHFVSAVALAESSDPPGLHEVFAAAGPAVAVRSSAIGEDGARASFAGQFATELNVTTVEALRAAIVAVHRSGQSPIAQLYRQRLGIGGTTSMAVVVQQMVSADCSGVLFTRDPVTGEDRCLIEASWGLGEAVVAGRVTPDSFQLSKDGAVLTRRIASKDILLRPCSSGGIEEVAVPASAEWQPCLSDPQLAELHELQRCCVAVFGTALDIEWAYAGGQLYLLQCRPITR